MQGDRGAALGLAEQTQRQPLGNAQGLRRLTQAPPARFEPDIRWQIFHAHQRQQAFGCAGGQQRGAGARGLTGIGRQQMEEGSGLTKEAARPFIVQDGGLLGDLARGVGPQQGGPGSDHRLHMPGACEPAAHQIAQGVFPRQRLRDRQVPKAVCLGRK